jgi:hypothetical protein
MQLVSHSALILCSRFHSAAAEASGSSFVI